MDESDENMLGTLQRFRKPLRNRRAISFREEKRGGNGKKEDKTGNDSK